MRATERLDSNVQRKMDTTTRAHREPSIAPSERATVHTDKFSVADHADLATSFTHTNSHSHKKGGAGHGDKDPGHDGAHSLKMTVHLDYFLDKKSEFLAHLTTFNNAMLTKYFIIH